MNKCVVVANGLIENVKVYKNLLLEADVIICADGGLTFLDAIGIVPTVIMGDFDSTEKKLLKQYQDSNIELMTFPKRKDSTDSELAIDYAVSLNPKEIIMIGMTGKRLDHGLTNLHMLKRIPRTIRASIVDAYNEIYYCDSDFEYNGVVGEMISIIPISNEVTGVSTYGLDYPLVQETLYLKESRGVSNVLKVNQIKIETQTGEFFVIISKD